jgi:hypothetical protein
MGIPRNVSTYAVARNLNGVSAGDREVLSSAIANPRSATEVPAMTVSIAFVPNPRII